jgi:hypothetical protein
LAIAIFDLQMFLLRCFAVAGGAGIGLVGGGWALRFFWRVLLHRPAPPRLLALARLLGMVILGVLVYLWVFGGGDTSGLGGGGGWWPFGGRGGGGSGSQTTGPSTAKQAATATRQQEKQPEPATPDAAHVLKVRLLGGKEVVAQRFYKVEGEAQAMTWTELLAFLEKRRKQDPALKEIDLLLYEDSVDRDNPAVTQLEDWARRNGLTPRLVFPPGPAKSS